MSHDELLKSIWVQFVRALWVETAVGNCRKYRHPKV